MEDDEYYRLRDLVEKDIEPNFKKTFDDFNWSVGFLSLIKDKNNKKDVVSTLNFIKENIFTQTIHSCLKIISKEYILIENIPSSKDIFGILSDRIKSNKKSIGFNKKKLMKYEKKKIKCKDYDELQKIKSEIFWCEHHSEGYKKEIYHYEHLRDCIKNDIRYISKQKTQSEIKEKNNE